jgi:hypothetical protein
MIVIAYGVNWLSTEAFQPEMIRSLKDNVLQLRINGGRFTKSKIPEAVAQINQILAQYPDTKELVLHYSHEIAPKLASTTDSNALSSLDKIQCKNITIFYGDINVKENLRWNFQNNIEFIGYDTFHWKHKEHLLWQNFSELGYRRDFDRKCSKKFSSLIGVIKNHRIYIASELFRQGYFDKGYTSCVKYEGHTDPNKTVQSENLHKKDYFFVEDIEDRYYQLLPHFQVADFEILNKKDGKKVCSSPLNWFSDSYFNIVNETSFSNDWPYNELFITEKTFKPIVHQMPFIVAGSAGTLEYLKSRGYQTFPEIFDESYDNEPNSYKRIAMIVEQIKRACDDPELHDKVYSIQGKLKHNRNIFFNV